jgi:hypothetical protein
MFFVLSFFFYKIRKQEGGTSPAGGKEGLAPVEVGRCLETGVGG